MKPDIWGPSGWLFLHSVAYNYPEFPTDTDKFNYGNFFRNIENILPCKICSQHYRENLQLHPVQLNSKNELVQWLILIHNKVNQKLDKPRGNYNDMLQLIHNGLPKKMTVNSIIFIIIIISLIIYIFFLHSNKKKWFIH